MNLANGDAYAHANSAGKLDEVTCRNIVSGEIGRESVDRVANAVVFRVAELCARIEHHGTICAAPLILARVRVTNSVMKGEAQGFVNVLTALLVEQVLLKVVT